jgi:hypothetical protein
MKLRPHRLAGFAGILALSMIEVDCEGLEIPSMRPTTQNGVSNGEATQLKKSGCYVN